MPDLDEWLATAQPGSRFVYYEGFLAKDCGDEKAKPTEKQVQLRALRANVQAALRSGRVTHTTRRLGVGHYTYELVMLAVPEPPELNPARGRVRTGAEPQPRSPEEHETRTSIARVRDRMRHHLKKVAA